MTEGDRIITASKTVAEIACLLAEKVYLLNQELAESRREIAMLEWELESRDYACKFLVASY